MALLPNTVHEEIDNRDADYFCNAMRHFLTLTAPRELVPT